MREVRRCWIHTLLFVNDCEMCRADGLAQAIIYGSTFLMRTEHGRLRLLDPLRVRVTPIPYAEIPL